MHFLEHSISHQEGIHVYDLLLFPPIFFPALHVADPDYETFAHQSSSVDQFFFCVMNFSGHGI